MRDAVTSVEALTSGVDRETIGEQFREAVEVPVVELTDQRRSKLIHGQGSIVRFRDSVCIAPLFLRTGQRNRLDRS